MEVVAAAGFALQGALQRAVDAGLAAAALVDRNGHTVAITGAITEQEAMPLAALVMYRLKSDDLAARMFGGELLTQRLEQRVVVVGVALRQLYVVAVLGATDDGDIDAVRELRQEIAEMLHDQRTGDVAGLPWSGGGRGGGARRSCW